MINPWRVLQIDGRRIATDQPAWIIAEIGVNHDGDPLRAEQLIEAAARAGADAVKFQLFRPDALVRPGTALSEYQRQRADDGDQRALLERLTLPDAALPRLRDAARDHGVTFFASPFDSASLARLEELGAPAIKLGSGELTHLELVVRAARSGLPLLLSTGMADWAEVDCAVRAVRATGARDPLLLHCVTSYPTPSPSANIAAVRTLAERTRCLTGYSDHCLEHEPSLAARALGACVLERHFTLDVDAPGPDHGTSLEPEQFAEWVQSVRRLELSLGDGEKRHAPLEDEGRQLARRSLHTRRAIPRGTALEEQMLVAVRPGGGLGPDQLERLLGRPVRDDLAAGQQLREEHLA